MVPERGLNWLGLLELERVGVVAEPTVGETGKLESQVAQVVFRLTRLFR